jgi:hypothetical protein
LLTKDKTINKSITVTVNMEHIDESGGDKYMTLKVELSDYVHTVKSKIASEILASWSHKIVKKMEDKELKEKAWQLYTSEGTHLLEDYFTLADYDIENNATICIFKDRVFGTKWVDVGNQVPQSLIEIKCPELATLLAKEAKGGIVDLELQQQAYGVGGSYFEPAPLSQNHCIKATNGRYDDMIT